MRSPVNVSSVQAWVCCFVFPFKLFLNPHEPTLVQDVDTVPNRKAGTAGTWDPATMELLRKVDSWHLSPFLKGTQRGSRIRLLHFSDEREHLDICICPQLLCHPAVYYIWQPCLLTHDLNAVAHNSYVTSPANSYVINPEYKHLHLQTVFRLSRRVVELLLRVRSPVA